MFNKKSFQKDVKRYHKKEYKIYLKKLKNCCREYAQTGITEYATVIPTEMLIYKDKIKKYFLNKSFNWIEKSPSDKAIIINWDLISTENKE